MFKRKKTVDSASNTKTSRKRGLSVGGKIRGGFTLVLGLSIALGVIGWFAISASQDGFTEYREMARDSNLTSNLQSHMLMMRMNVKDYLITNSDKDIKQYKQYKTLFDKDLATAKVEIQDPERAEKIATVDQEILSYEAGFDEVITFMNERHKLVSETLNVKGPHMENTLTEILISAENDEDMAAAFHSGLAMKHLLLARLYMSKFLDTNDQAAVDRVHEEYNKMQEQLTILDEELQDPQRREWLTGVQDAKKTYLSAFDRLTTVITDRNEIVKGSLDRIGPQIAADLNHVNEDIQAAQDEIGPALVASMAASASQVISVAIGAVLLGAVLAFFIARSISRRIVAMSDMLKDISEGEGDLTKRLDVKSGDEIGQTALYFNQFVEKLQVIIQKMAANAQTLSGGATELSATASQLASGAEATNTQSATVAAAAEEMSVNMNNMASSTEEMTTNVKTVATSVDEMTASISEIAQNAEKASTVASDAANLAKTSNDSIGELGTAADEIGKVIETIQDIAEQTNLLALNATIEAARAGDAGKGFAVVATEVKELAHQTAGATEDIRSRIEGIQSSTGSAVTSIGQISEVIQQVNDVSKTIASAVEEQSITTREIAQNIAQTSNAAASVSIGVNESASASQEITQNIASVDEGAKQTATGASQTQSAGAEMSTLAEEMQTLIGQFTV